MNWPWIVRCSKVIGSAPGDAMGRIRFRMMTKQFAGRVGAVLIFCLSIFAADQSRKEFKYIVGPKASVTINNEYGPVSVKPSGSNQVVVTATTHSDKVEVDDAKIGNRIEFRSHR